MLIKMTKYCHDITAADTGGGDVDKTTCKING